MPQRFVDHTHADAILLLTNQPDGQALVREALGEQVAILPYIMPGFPLAKAVADAFERQPDCVGIVLLHHGIFTFGDTAKQSYERMIALVSAAERFATQRIGAVPAMLRSEPAPLRAAERQTALRQMRCGGEPDRSGADDGNRKVVCGCGGGMCDGHGHRRAFSAPDRL